MIAPSENHKSGIWAELAAPLPADVVQWRQQGRAKPRDGKFFAMFVAYIDAQFVRSRLDAVVPGEWDLTLTELPQLPTTADGEVNDEPVCFKARLQILGVIREDVGSGRDYKNASTDAFKRAAVRFGVGHELYTDYEITYVQVDGDGKFAKPLEDPAQAFARKQSRGPSSPQRAVEPTAPRTPAPTTAPKADTTSAPACPKCSGLMWDNRLTKKNPKQPDYKCRDKSCDGVIWPPKAARQTVPGDDYADEYDR